MVIFVMQGLISIFVIAGIGYSAILILVISKVSHDLFLSPVAKKWLIGIAILLPLLGPIIASSKTTSLTSTKDSNVDMSTNISTGNSYDGSGDCGGGSE